VASFNIDQKATAKIVKVILHLAKLYADYEDKFAILRM
jgi:hypothetical protein